MPESALIIIDMQYDFCPDGALAVAGGDEIVTGINGLMNHHGAVILTQDWHPAGHSSFATSHAGKSPFEVIDMPYGAQVLWPDHCVQGSRGAQLHAELAVDRADLILRKGYTPEIDSYSAFFENDHHTPTGLHGYLQERRIKAVTLVGLATDFCVKFSALDARRLGYDARLETAFCRGIDMEGSLAAAMAEMAECGVILA